MVINLEQMHWGCFDSCPWNHRGKEKSVGLINTNKRGCGEKKHFPKFKDNRTYIFYVTLSSKLSKVIYKVFMKISLNSTKTAFCVIYVK